MQRGLALLRLSVFLLLSGFSFHAVADRQAKRIISADGAITEIIYALKAEDRLVGVDTTSQYPSETKTLASVGYKRRLSAEGVLSLNPDLVLVNKDAGPPQVLEQLRTAGTRLHTIPSQPTIAGLEEKVRTVAKVLNLSEQGEVLLHQIHNDLAAAKKITKKVKASDRLRVLFLLQIGQGNDLSSGRNTTADTMIQLAGGINVMHDAFESYKPLTAEAAIAAAPDILLISERNLAMLGGIEGLMQRPGLANTPAVKAKRIVSMNGLYLLGLGPRTGKAVSDLAQAFYPNLKMPSSE